MKMKTTMLPLRSARQVFTPGCIASSISLLRSAVGNNVYERASITDETELRDKCAPPAMLSIPVFSVNALDPICG
jgi:hypothetical protein